MVKGQQPVGYPKAEAEEVIDDKESYAAPSDPLNQFRCLFHCKGAETSDYFINQ
jgi:hypothetical protein